MLAIPPAFARAATATWGNAGQQWLAELPHLLTATAADWELDLGAPFALSQNWVCSVRRADGSPAVLKLGPPGPGHLRNEATALRAFDGRGAVRLLAENPERGALLLESAVPGERLRALVPQADTDATSALVAVARRLHRPPPAGCPLPRLADRRRTFTRYFATDRSAGPLPRDLVEQAASVFDDLCADALPAVVLHGDLHHDNILRTGSGRGAGAGWRGARETWCAIDPHGLVGDPGYDAGALLYNPDPPHRDSALLAFVLPRVEQLADGLGQPTERIVAWGFVAAVISEIWRTEDDPASAPGRALDVARLLLPRLSG